MPARVVFCTARNRREAERLSRQLVEERLAACVSVAPGLKSRYRWKGKIEVASEVLLIIKTSAARYPKLEKRLKALHSYTVPEILAMPVIAGNPDYLKWLNESL